MIFGHGDDLFQYKNIHLNFSSNIYLGFDHKGLEEYLKDNLEVIYHYPTPIPIELEEKLSDSYEIGKNEILVTSGATSAIYLLAQVFQGSTSFIISPTFSEFFDASRIFHHRINLIDSLSKINEKANIVWVCSPNNPTGKVVNKDLLKETILLNKDTIFIVDESYSSYTLLPTISPKEATKFSNLLILQSMTKQYGVPGLRLGCIVGNSKLIEKVRNHQIPWPVNSLAIKAGIYLLEHKKDYRIPIENLLKENKRIRKVFSKTQGIKVYPSDCHILLLELLNSEAKTLKSYLAQENKILIRDASNFQGLSNGHFRIAVQNYQNDNILINAIKEWLTL